MIIISIIIQVMYEAHYFVVLIKTVAFYFSEMFRTSKLKPTASEVLTCHLKQCNEPHWTSYFVKYKDVHDDQRGMSHFNWKAGNSNYHILRTGCFPYVKYHCSKHSYEDLTTSDRLIYVMKICNLGNFAYLSRWSIFIGIEMIITFVYRSYICRNSGSPIWYGCHFPYNTRWNCEHSQRRCTYLLFIEREQRFYVLN